MPDQYTELSSAAPTGGPVARTMPSNALGVPEFVIRRIRREARAPIGRTGGPLATGRWDGTITASEAGIGPNTESPLRESSHRPVDDHRDDAPRATRARATDRHLALTRSQQIQKRAFDIVLSIVGLALLGWLILLALVAATFDTRASGLFRQDRIGLHGRTFKILKIRTMRADPEWTTSVTTADDPRITRLGRFFRRTKIDELPQLLNVLVGQMSFVGPRPEVPGFADLLTGDDARILSVRPGITGPATLHFRNEEELLRGTDDPEAYNATVLFPAKVRLNLAYIRDYSLRGDLLMIWETLR